MDAEPTPEELREEKAFQDWRSEERRRLRQAQYRRQVLVCAFLVVFLSSLLTAGIGFTLIASIAVCLPLAACLWLRLDQFSTLLLVGPIVCLVNWPNVFLILIQVVLISFVARFYALRLDL